VNRLAAGEGFLDAFYSLSMVEAPESSDSATVRIRQAARISEIGNAFFSRAAFDGSVRAQFGDQG
jgi:hypothetical protein